MYLLSIYCATNMIYEIHNVESSPICSAASPLCKWLTWIQMLDGVLLLRLNNITHTQDKNCIEACF